MYCYFLFSRKRYIDICRDILLMPAAMLLYLDKGNQFHCIAERVRRSRPRGGNWTRATTGFCRNHLTRSSGPAPTTNNVLAVVDCSSSATTKKLWPLLKFIILHNRLSLVMPSMRIVLVSFCVLRSCFRRLSYPPEVAISLNTHEAQILTHTGSDWTPIETLSEVDLHRS